MTKPEKLFDLSNAELKARLKAEGISYGENDTKKELVSKLNGDFVELAGVEGPEEVDLGGAIVGMSDVVKEAFEESGLDKGAWNGLSEVERWRFITPVLDAKRALIAQTADAASSSLSEDEIVGKDAVAPGESVSAGEGTSPATDAGSLSVEELVKVVALKDDVIAKLTENNDKANQENNELRGAVLKLTRERDEAQDRANKLSTSGGHIDDLPKLGQ